MHNLKNIDVSIPKRKLIVITGVSGMTQLNNNVYTDLTAPSNGAYITSDSGSVSVSSEILEEDNGQCRLKFSVKDTGIGILKQEQEKVFRPFEQLKGGKTRKYEGTGLGLAICKKLVGLLGRDIGLSSKLGAGSELWICLPIDKGGSID